MMMAGAGRLLRRGAVRSRRRRLPRSGGRARARPRHRPAARARYPGGLRDQQCGPDRRRWWPSTCWSSGSPRRPTTWSPRRRPRPTCSRSGSAVRRHACSRSAGRGLGGARRGRAGRRASADDRPVAVIQGFGSDLTWQHLNEAAIAIHRGAHWVATNIDSDPADRPRDRARQRRGRGRRAQAVTVEPEVAGKPYRPLVDETVQRLGARRPIFVGDRLDTDIAGAVAAGLDSMLVLTGAHGAAELLAAGSGPAGPTHLGYDLRDLLAPVRPPRQDRDESGRARTQTAAAGSDRLEITHRGAHAGRRARRPLGRGAAGLAGRLTAAGRSTSTRVRGRSGRHPCCAAATGSATLGHEQRTRQEVVGHGG